MIAYMHRLEIVCLRELLPDVTAFMQEIGVLHVEEAPLAVEDAPDFLSRVQIDASQRKEYERIESLQRSVSEVLPLLNVRPNPRDLVAATAIVAKMSDDDIERAVTARTRELRSLVRRRLNAQDNVEILSNFQRTLERIQPLLGGRNVVLGKDARAFVLKGDVAKLLESIGQRSRREIGPDCRIIHQRVARNTVVALMTYPPNLNDAVTRMLHEEHIAQVEAPDKDLRGGTVGEVLGKVRTAIAKWQSNATELTRQLTDCSKIHCAELYALNAVLSDRLAEFSVQTQFAQSNMVAVIHGWAPADEESSLVARIERRFPDQVMVTRLPIDGINAHNVPTLLRNNALFKPFEVLLSLFKPPTYGTIDPTPLVAISFIFFYGLILGDILYGVAVILFAQWLKRRFGHIEAVRAAGTVGVYMGISGIFFGVLFMEFAGDLPQRMFGLHPIWLHRSHDIIDLMLVAIVVGAIHIPLALVLGIRADLKHHHTKHAKEKLGLLLGLCGIGIFAMNFFGVPGFDTSFALIVAGLLFVSFIGLLVSALGISVLTAVTALEVISLLGNVLSYCRLMALGLAAVLIADLANKLVDGLGMFIGLPLAIVVHVFNIALAIFSPTLHSLRLNYVEFLPKFYKPEGKSYKPFKKEASW